jgi:hypothetical protein
MLYEKKVKTIPINLFEPCSSNQHGVRYRFDKQIQLNVSRISVHVGKAMLRDYEELILLSNVLQTTLDYDFEQPQNVSLEIVSAREIFEKLMRR